MNVRNLVLGGITALGLMTASLWTNSAEAGTLSMVPGLSQSIAPTVVGFHRYHGWGYGGCCGWRSYYYGRPSLYYSYRVRPHRTVVRYNYAPAYSYGYASPFYVNTYPVQPTYYTSVPSYVSYSNEGYSSVGCSNCVGSAQTVETIQPVADSTISSTVDSTPVYRAPVYTAPTTFVNPVYYAPTVVAAPVYAAPSYYVAPSYYSGVYFGPGVGYTRYRASYHSPYYGTVRYRASGFGYPSMAPFYVGGYW